MKIIKEGHEEWAAKYAPASNYKGVCATKSLRNPWEASIGIQYKTRHLGIFPTEEEAALEYDRAARERWGEEAVLNFSEGVPDDVMEIIQAGRDRAKFKSKAYLSKYRGVSQHRGSSTWFAQIIRKSDKKKIYLGIFKTQQEAARAYDKKSLELHGEFAYLNFPEEHNRKEQ